MAVSTSLRQCGAGDIVQVPPLTSLESFTPFFFSCFLSFFSARPMSLLVSGLWTVVVGATAQVKLPQPRPR